MSSQPEGQDPQGAALGPGRRVRGHLPDDVQEGRHRAVPVREAAHRAALPRPAPAQPLARRPGEVHRLRAVRLGLPGRRDLRRGRVQHRRTSGFSPGERYGRVYQINYLRCILCGLCIEACPTRALTMTNEYELADDNRADLIYEKPTCSPRCCPAWSSRRTRCGSATTRATTTAARSSAGTARRRRRRRRRRDRLLDPGPDHGARRARHPVRPQGRARRAAAGGRDDQPRGALRRRWTRRSCSRCRSSSTPARS